VSDPASSPALAQPVEILIIGAGVLGLCAAVELIQRGHEVAVVDPGQRTDWHNASAVAAGMVAPALESAIDDVTPEWAALLREAAELWPEFAERERIVLRTGPAVWRGDGADQIESRLRALGFEADRAGDVVSAPQDYQVEPVAALAALRARVGTFHHGEVRSVVRDADGWRVTTDAGVIAARIVVLATGAAEPLAGLPSALAARVGVIEPVLGQIGRVAEAVSAGVVRGVGAYAAPGDGGTLIGATMEPGRRDLEPDPVKGAALLAAVAKVLGCAPITQDVDWRVGVRGSTPDGLPMAGASGEAGLFLALAPRRNGWLLGPLVGRVVADAIEGREAEKEDGGIAAALDPLRF